MRKYLAVQPVNNSPSTIQRTSCSCRVSRFTPENIAWIVPWHNGGIAPVLKIYLTNVRFLDAGKLGIGWCLGDSTPIYGR